MHIFGRLLILTPLLSLQSCSNKNSDCLRMNDVRAKSTIEHPLVINIPGTYDKSRKNQIEKTFSSLKRYCPDCSYQVANIDKLPIVSETKFDAGIIDMDATCSVPKWLADRRDILSKIALKHGRNFEKADCDKVYFLNLIDSLK